MKSLLTLCAMAVAGCAFAMTDIERQYLRNLSARPRCEARELVVQGGTTNIVETWRRGGYEWKQTNAVRRIIGKVQSNTFKEQIQSYRLDAETARDIRKMAKKAEKNLEKVLKVLNQAVNKASTEEEAELYQAIINLLEGAE